MHTEQDSHALSGSFPMPGGDAGLVAQVVAWAKRMVGTSSALGASSRRTRMEALADEATDHGGAVEEAVILLREEDLVEE